MRIAEPSLDSGEWEQRLGEQFRALRIAAGLDQATLAERAGLSIGAVRGLERGTGSSLKTVVQVSRSLGREDWLASIAPRVSVSPIDVARSGRRTRSRVYRPRGEAG
jgi:transcriptional regulator with XRE-family HTH domain